MSVYGFDASALDRHITGNYGEDQYDNGVPCATHGFDCDADEDDCEPVEDDRDFDALVWDHNENDWITQEEEAYRIAVWED